MLMHVGNKSVVVACNRGRATNRETRAFLVQLFDL